LSDITSVILALGALAFAIWLFFVLPYQMAVRRNRNGWLWILISLVGSPLLAILLLFALGDAPRKSLEEYGRL